MTEQIPLQDLKDHQVIKATCTDGNGNKMTIYLMDRSIHAGWADWTLNRKQAKPLAAVGSADLKVPAENFLGGGVTIEPTDIESEPFYLPTDSAPEAAESA